MSSPYRMSTSRMSTPPGEAAAAATWSRNGTSRRRLSRHGGQHEGPEGGVFEDGDSDEPLAHAHDAASATSSPSPTTSNIFEHVARRRVVLVHVRHMVVALVPIVILASQGHELAAFHYRRPRPCRRPRRTTAPPPPPGTASC
jgi:hypothetical protein